MPKYLVVSTSGNPDSNSRRMGRIAFGCLQKAKVDCEWLDISELGLPLCDADTCYTQPARSETQRRDRGGGRNPHRDARLQL